MEAAKVCRICLIMDVNMFNLQTEPLRTCFESIIGLNTLNIMEFPPFACYECAALVKKYYHFRNKCLKGQDILCEILNENRKITKEHIQQIDRAGLQLSSNHTINEIPQERIIHKLYEEDSQSENKDGLTLVNNEGLVVETKKEYYVEIKKESGSENWNSPFSEGNTESNIEVTIKQEDYFDNISSFHSSDESSFGSLFNNRDDKETVKNNTKKEITQTVTQCEIKLVEIPNIKKEVVKRKAPVTQQAKSTTGKRPNIQVNKGQPKREGNVGEDQLDKKLEEYATIIKLTLEEQLEELNNRRESPGYLRSVYKCELCCKPFTNAETAQRHHNLKHDPSAGDLVCPVCKCRFKNKSDFHTHIHMHDTKYACKTCPFVSKAVYQAKIHQKWHDGVTYKCQYCGDTFEKRTSYMSHVRKKHPSQFLCGVCGQSFISQLGLTLHKTMMHKDVGEINEPEKSTDSGIYCEECDVSFLSEEAFKKHMVNSANHIQTTITNNGCRTCGEMFTTPKQLRIHRKKHSSIYPLNYLKHTVTYPVNCEHCPAVLSTGREVRSHYHQMHPDENYPIEKNFTCEICGKGFSSRSFLEYHMCTHSGEKPFKCSSCSKSFHNPTNLRIHEKSHSEARPFPCTECDKAFKFQAALDRHVNCHHRDIRPFACSMCGKAFGLLRSRDVHVRTVHLKEPQPKRIRRRVQPRKKFDI